MPGQRTREAFGEDDDTDRNCYGVPVPVLGDHQPSIEGDNGRRASLAQVKSTSASHELLINLCNLTVPQGKNLVIMQCSWIYVDQIIPWKAKEEEKPISTVTRYRAEETKISVLCK